MPTIPDQLQKAFLELPLEQGAGGGKAVRGRGGVACSRREGTEGVIAEELTVSLRWRQMSCETRHPECALRNCTCKKQDKTEVRNQRGL